MKAKLKPSRRPLGGERLELSLGKAWQPEVFRVVRIGLGERGGARPQRAIQKPLELREMQPRVCGCMAGPALLERRERQGEIEPFGNSPPVAFPPAPAAP